MVEPRTARIGGTDTVLDDRVIEELGSRFRCELLRPGGAGYEASRKVWNGSISRFPALIARCAGAAEVIAALRYARDTGIVVADRGGGTASPASRSATAGSS